MKGRREGILIRGKDTQTHINQTNQQSVPTQGLYEVPHWAGPNVGCVLFQYQHIIRFGYEKETVALRDARVCVQERSDKI